MGTRRLIVWVCLWAIVTMLPAAGRGSETGWISLFDGKSLTGWKANENPGTFTVTDGAIVAHGRRSHLFYTGPVEGANFQDFELKVDVKTALKANSGVFFHTAFQHAGWPEKGYEAQINNTHAGSGDYRELKKTGSLYAVRNVFASPVADDVWFTMYIKVLGRRVRIRVNEFLLVDYIEPEDPVRGAEHKGSLLSSGTFALQGHDVESKVCFKNIYVRPLGHNPRPADTRSAEELAYEREIAHFHTNDLPLVDFHVHLKGGLTLPEALDMSREAGITYGIAQNCGVGFPVTNDDGLRTYLATLTGRPAFKGVQAEGREWVGLFSEEELAKFDYIFTDSMTFTDHRGKRTRLWMPDEVQVDDEQAFMEMLVGKIETIMSEEPVDIYVNPTFLPACIAEKYDALWTEERMDRVVKALAENGVAMEINARYRLPSETFVRKAKAAGVKFAFGTNNGGRDLGTLAYSRMIARRCGLTKKDFFMPKPDGHKAIQRKGLPKR